LPSAQGFPTGRGFPDRIQRHRFFEAKIDIAESMARKHYADEQAELSAIARKKDLPADVRLREMFFKRLRDSYCLLEESAKIMEIAEVLHRERPLFANEQLALERVFLIAVLEDGEKAGIFAPGDHAVTAEMMQAATMKFGVPQLFSQLTLPKLERELEGVLGLILNGLYRRAAAQPAPTRAPESAEA
jgi:hypothetical protein